MTSEGFELFDTAIGRCAIAWGAKGIVGLTLPERNDSAMRARMRRLHSKAQEVAAPSEVAAIVADV
jgi:methylated-DNA-[protein]-cysteine S-methyltransferase